MMYQKMLEESFRVQAQIKMIQEQLKTFPEGKLICAINGTGDKWYRSDGHKSTYLPKQERELAKKLAHKKYLSLQLKHLLQEKSAIDFYLRHHNVEAYQEEQTFLNSPKYKQLLEPVFVSLESELQEWSCAPYEKNNKYIENLVHKTYSGNLVRSKSEALIDMVLFKNNIPFRYECLLQLGEAYVYPDFTIRHPRTGETFYWEHFGMMDNSNYCQKACSKIQLYSSYGIYPTIQLITTYETKQHPLSTDVIRKIVEHYFL